MRKCFIVLLLCLTVLNCVTPAAALDGQVIYVDGADKFIFLPASNHSPTDLFPEFKDVMPGDTITQRILIRNDASNQVKVKIYLRSLGANAESEDFLSQLMLEIKQASDTVLFAAPADQSAQLTDWVCLGTFYSGAEVALDVTLTVPASLDNRYKDMAGYLDWEFMVEEYPVEDTDPPAPDTGDASDPWLYLGLFCGGALLLVLLYVTRRGKKDR